MAAPAIDAKIIFMDAGQGDATLIVRGNHRILIDCGSSHNTEVVQQPIEAIFVTEGVYNAAPNGGLDALILTHPDIDHYNLVKRLLIDRGVEIRHLYFGGQANQYKVGGLSTWLNNPSANPVYKNIVCHPLGDKHFSSDVVAHLSGGGMDVRIVAANFAGQANSVGTSKNLNSIVVFVTYDEATILLMGDSFEANENWIIAQDAQAGPNQFTLANLVKKDDLRPRKRGVLKVGHHGSGTSTGSKFLDWANPNAAFISSDTKTFSGTSTCLKAVIDSLLPIVAEGGPNNAHTYVRYNKDIQRHEPQGTTKWLYTTLNQFALINVVKDGKELFQVAGASHYYTFDQTGHHVGLGWGAVFYGGDYDEAIDMVD